MVVIENVKGASYSKPQLDHILDYGLVQKGNEPIVEFEISGEGIKDLKLLKTCGCSVTNTNLEGSVWKSSIKYTATSVKGQFQKTVKINYQVNGKEKQELIKIKGNVV